MHTCFCTTHISPCSFVRTSEAFYVLSIYSLLYRSIKLSEDLLLLLFYENLFLYDYICTLLCRCRFTSSLKISSAAETKTNHI